MKFTNVLLLATAALAMPTEDPAAPPADDLAVDPSMGLGDELASPLPDELDFLVDEEFDLTGEGCTDSEIVPMGPPPRKHYSWMIRNFRAKFFPHDDKKSEYKYEFEIKGKHYKDCNYKIPAFWGKCTGCATSDWTSCWLDLKHMDSTNGNLHDSHRKRNVKLWSKLVSGPKDKARFEVSFTYYQPWKNDEWIHWNYTSSFSEHRRRSFKIFPRKTDEIR